MGVGSFGFGATGMATVAMMNAGRYRGGGYSEPPKNKNNGVSRHIVTIIRTCILVIILSCLGLCSLDDYYKEKPITVTITAKEIMLKGSGKYSTTEPTVAVRTDDGMLFDARFSLAYYNDIRIGDRIILERSEAFLHPNSTKEKLRFIPPILIILSLVFFLITEIIWDDIGIIEKEEESNDG